MATGTPAGSDITETWAMATCTDMRAPTAGIITAAKAWATDTATCTVAAAWAMAICMGTTPTTV